MDLKSEIMRRVEALPLNLQRELLAYFDALEQRAHGERGADLLPFAGVLDGRSAEEMSRAIESACEVVDIREW